MSSVQCLRTFVMERLTVAAEEIFRVFQLKLDGYEEELDYQRRLVESVWRPQLKLHRTDGSLIFTHSDVTDASDVWRRDVELHRLQSFHSSNLCGRRKRIITSIRIGAAVWIRRTQSLHKSMRNRKIPAVIRMESR
ncbi:uncharacterized protein LOC130520622 isoform X2 [Takifugu flavidus]|uniref:uncharacterized protein LOC130520622 isoform X2 n=1 Tax=Takifugu flavidus TaxID=433684 RepID=UPI00254404C5|nr:uncharacterized protein LOC130520622 isoform X2 [Takifugu flavidus]